MVVRVKIWLKLNSVSLMTVFCKSSFMSTSDNCKELIMSVASSFDSMLRSILVPIKGILSEGTLKKTTNSVVSTIMSERKSLNRKSVVYFVGTEGHVGKPMTSVLYEVSPSRMCKALVIVSEQRSWMRSSGHPQPT